MTTPKQKSALARKLETEAKLPPGAAPKRTSKQQHDISPRTNLPVEHPESQAVERIHYEMQTSLCGLPLTQEQKDILLKKGINTDD